MPLAFVCRWRLRGLLQVLVVIRRLRWTHKVLMFPGLQTPRSYMASTLTFRLKGWTGMQLKVRMVLMRKVTFPRWVRVLTVLIGRITFALPPVHTMETRIALLCRARVMVLVAIRLLVLIGIQAMLHFPRLRVRKACRMVRRLIVAATRRLLLGKPVCRKLRTVRPLVLALLSAKIRLLFPMFR